MDPSELKQNERIDLSIKINKAIQKLMGLQ